MNEQRNIVFVETSHLHVTFFPKADSIFSLCGMHLKFLKRRSL